MNFNYIVQTLLDGILMGGVYALVAIGLTLIFGVMKIINFAHGSLMMIGMYATYWAVGLLHIDPYLSILIVLPLLFFIGAAFQKFLIGPIINAPEHNQLFLTLGVSLFLQNLAIFLWSPDFRVLQNNYSRINFYIGDVGLSLVKLISFGLAMAFAAILYILLAKTDLGRAIRAMSSELTGAALMGVNIRRLYWISFGIGTACVGVAGAAITPFFPIYPYVGEIFILPAYVVVVLGGLGSVGGAFVGGLIIGLADSIGAMLFPPDMKSILSFTIFILVMLFKPTGLFGRKNA